MKFTMISNYNRRPDVSNENKTDSQLIPMLRLSKQWGPPHFSGPKSELLCEVAMLNF